MSRKIFNKRTHPTKWTGLATEITERKPSKVPMSCEIVPETPHNLPKSPKEESPPEPEQEAH